MSLYACSFTRAEGYGPIPFEVPPRPANKADMSGCIHYKAKEDGVCRLTGAPCDAEEVK